MTIRFAATRPLAMPALFTEIGRTRLAALAANDNGDAFGEERRLRSALKHFAEHGLRASRDAAQRAERAHRTGDTKARNHWLEVCRALDPRLASQLQARLARLNQ